VCIVKELSTRGKRSNELCKKSLTTVGQIPSLHDIESIRIRRDFVGSARGSRDESDATWGERERIGRKAG